MLLIKKHLPKLLLKNTYLHNWKQTPTYTIVKKYIPTQLKTNTYLRYRLKYLPTDKNTYLHYR